MLAYVVTVRGAAFPGAAGLLHPLLHRWQAGGCSYTAFALPAVQVGPHILGTSPKHSLMHGAFRAA